MPNPKDSLLSWILEPNPMTCVPLDIMLRCACALRAVEEQDMQKARGLLLGEKENGEDWRKTSFVTLGIDHHHFSWLESVRFCVFVGVVCLKKKSQWSQRGWWGSLGNFDSMEGAKGTKGRIYIIYNCIFDDPITTNHNRCSWVRLVDYWSDKYQNI